MVKTKPAKNYCPCALAILPDAPPLPNLRFQASPMTENLIPHRFETPQPIDDKF